MTNGSHDKSALPLGEAIERHLSGDALREDQLQELMSMQREVLAGEPADHAGGNGNRRAALAALCATLLLAVVLLWQLGGPGATDPAQQIALEVVENHLKLKPLDTSAGSMKEIRDFFTQLDFAPVNSRLLDTRFELPESSMLGGRYCSIKGVTAAQLRYQRGADGLSTLYEVAYDRKRHGPMPHVGRGDPPRELMTRGLHVHLWVERGLLMVLVDDR